MTVPSIDETIAAAQGYLALGFTPIQLHGLRKDTLICTCKKGEKCGNSSAKHPVDDDWEQTTWESPEALAEAFRRRPWAHNVGILTGAASGGAWVLDIDPDKGGLDNAKRMIDGQEEISPTRTVRTGSGGFHYYFKTPVGAEIRNAQDLAKYKGVDVRGEGGQVVAPPSVSAKGPYRFVSEITDIAVPPDWLVDLVIRKAPAERPSAPLPEGEITAIIAALDDKERHRLQKYASDVVGKELHRLDELTRQGWEGEAWDGTTYNVACSLIEIANSPWNTYSVEQAYHDLITHSPRDENFDDERVNTKWQSAIGKVGENARPIPAPPTRYDDFFDGPDVRTASTPDPSSGDGDVAPAPPPVFPTRSWDDLGNAKRMVDRHASRLRWIEQADTWAVYTHGRWETSGPRLAQALVQHLMDRLVDDEADRYSDAEIFNPGGKPEITMREAFVKWAKAQRMSARIQACLTETKAAPALQARLTDFDADPLLFNAANGVVDLQTGTMVEHDPKLLLMQQSPIGFDATAPAQRWQAFLDRVMPDPADQLYLQAIVGYSITGKTAEQAMFLHHGVGANGKSVFLQVMTAVVGDYGQVVPRSTLLVTQNDQHPEAVARMVGKRFLQTSETAAGRRLDEEIVKGLTGGEMQTARFMHQGSFDFRPTGKIHYVSNHLPRLTNAPSIWRRMHLIAWKVTIPEDERDGDLADKIIANEAEGVLAWCVRGAQMWLENGLPIPDSAREGLADYRSSQDVFGDFLAERTVRRDGVKTPSAQLYDSYSVWCFKNGIRKPMTAQAFGATLLERDFVPYRSAKSRGFCDIAVVPVMSDIDSLMGE